MTLFLPIDLTTSILVRFGHVRHNFHAHETHVFTSIALVIHPFGNRLPVLVVRIYEYAPERMNMISHIDTVCLSKIQQRIVHDMDCHQDEFVLDLGFISEDNGD